MKYYLSKRFKNVTLDALRPKVEEELKKEGFGILTEIDIQATMKKKLNKTYLPHVILGACNPVYADKVLSVEPTISNMLPCNVTLRQLESGEIEVAIIDSLAAMGVVGNPALEVHAKEVNDKLEHVLANI